MEEFHEDKTRLSELLPCSEALIFPKRSSTSEEEVVEGEEGGDSDFVVEVVVLLALQKQKKKRRKSNKDMGMWREKGFRNAMT